MTTIRRRSAFDLIFADHGQVRISDDFPRHFVLSDRKYLIAPSGLAMIGLAMSDRLRRSFRIAVSSATRVKLAQTFAAPETAYSTGQFNKMPIMGGTTHDEGTFSNASTAYFSGPPQTPMTAAQYVANVTNAYPPATAAAVLAEYSLANYASPQLAWSAVSTDPLACQSRHLVPLWAQFATNHHCTFWDPILGL
jgi:carboxylesterase type B